MPIRPNDLKKLEEKNVFPEGISIIKGKDGGQLANEPSSKFEGLPRKMFSWLCTQCARSCAKGIWRRKQSNGHGELAASTNGSVNVFIGIEGRPLFLRLYSLTIATGMTALSCSAAVSAASEYLHGKTP